MTIKETGNVPGTMSRVISIIAHNYFFLYLFQCIKSVSFQMGKQDTECTCVQNVHYPVAHTLHLFVYLFSQWM